MPVDDDLGIYSEVPFLDRLQRGLTQLLALLFLNKAAMYFWDLGYVLVVCAIVARPAWMHAHGRAFGVSLVAILVVVFSVWGNLIVGLLPFILRVEYGPPIFGDLGGSPRRVFFAMVRCADAFKWGFRPEDLALVKAYGCLDRDVTEWTLKNAYHQLQAAKGAAALQDFEQSWSNVWRQKILSLQIQVGPNRWVKLDDAFSEDNWGIRVEPIKLTVVSNILAPIVKLVQLVMIFLLARFVDGRIQLLTVVQSGLFLGLVVCLILFLYHAHQNAAIPFIGSVVPNLPEPLKERLKPFAGVIVRPTKVTVTPRYLTLIQNYFAEGIAMWTVLNTISSLLIVGVVLLVTRLWHPAILHAVLPWYREFSMGLLFVPTGLLAIYFLMFLVLRNFKLVLAPIVLGLLTVLIPYAFTYLAGGRVDLSQMKNAMVAVFTGLGATLAAVVASRVKKIMTGGGEKEADGANDQTAVAAG